MKQDLRIWRSIFKMLLRLYVKIYLQFFKTSLSRLLIYRKNFWIHIGCGFMWLAYYVLSVEMIFRHVPTIRGWTRGEAFLIVATLFIVEAFGVTFFCLNFR